MVIADAGLDVLTYSMRTSRLGRLSAMAALAQTVNLEANRLRVLAHDGRCRCHCGRAADAPAMKTDGAGLRTTTTNWPSTMLHLQRHEGTLTSPSVNNSVRANRRPATSQRAVACPTGRRSELPGQLARHRDVCLRSAVHDHLVAERTPRLELAAAPRRSHRALRRDGVLRLPRTAPVACWTCPQAWHSARQRQFEQSLNCQPVLLSGPRIVKPRPTPPDGD